MENIESKLRTERIADIEKAAHDLGANNEGILAQKDTYFRVKEGRLKLREIGNNTELIYYVRPNTQEARSSLYDVLALTKDIRAKLYEMLSKALGVIAIVDKERKLYLYKNTRIHLDMVKDLGTFVELETVMREQTRAEAEEEHAYVFKSLGLDGDEWVSESYIDLITRINKR